MNKIILDLNELFTHLFFRLIKFRGFKFKNHRAIFYS